MKQKYKFLIILPLIIVALDQLTKLLVREFMQPSQSIPIIKNIFHITYTHNTGTFFGLMQGANTLFIWFSIIIIGVVIYLFDSFNKVESSFFALIMGAAIGNLIDRIAYGHVVDFLDFRIWPVFNIADCVISVCVILLIIYLIKKKA